MRIGVISHGLAAVAMLILFLLLMTSWRGRLKGALLVISVFISLLWGIAAAYYAGTDFSDGGALYRVLEVARSVVWLIFLLHLAEPLMARAGGRTLRWLYPAIGVFAGLLLLADLLPQRFAGLGLGAEFRIFGHLGLAVGGLALIEQLFRNTRPDQRWATKFLYLGIGALFAYDFFLYADTLLLRRIDSNIWHARGLVMAMLAPFIAVAAARNPQWSLQVFVSRRMVLHSAAVMGAGLYLLVMAGAGYYIRAYGGAWGAAMQMAFLFGAGLLLLTMMFSGQMQASAKVFFSKHFFNYKYDYREEWLKFIDTLWKRDTDEPPREHAIRAIAGILDSPGGVLWTRTEDGGYRLAASWNMGEQGLLVESGGASLVRFLKNRQWLIELDELAAEPELYEDLALPSWMKGLPRAWIVAPLLQGAELEGFVVLARPRAGRQINWEDRDLLKTAGRQVAGYVRLLETTDALMDARQFDAFNRLSAYVVHDLKNVAAQLSLVVSNAARHKANPAFVDDAIRTVENATSRMNRMLAQLRKGIPSAGDVATFSLDAALQGVVAACSPRQPRPVLAVTDPTLKVKANRDRCISVLGHLLQNAQEATEANGKVELKLYRDCAMAVIEISDDGCGMDERFIRERLFRPFTTTKGNAGMGIGVYESREFVQALGGRIDVVSKPGVGTTFFLYLPLVADDAVGQDSSQDEGVSVARTDHEASHGYNRTNL